MKNNSKFKKKKKRVRLWKRKTLIN